LGINVNPDLTDPYHIEVKPIEIDAINKIKGAFIRKNGGVYIEYVKKENGELDISIRTEGKYKVKY